MSINRRLPDEITTLLNAAGTGRAFLRNSAVTVAESSHGMFGMVTALIVEK